MKFRYKKNISTSSAFTIIELLVVISIIGLLVGLSVFGLNGARQASRDAKRKADLEQIRSGLEIYKADCNSYPSSLNLSSSTVLRGDGASSPNCLVANIYISATPIDPLSPNSRYVYSSTGSNQNYNLCAALEQPPIPSMSTSGCGSCGGACNYKVTQP